MDIKKLNITLEPIKCLKYFFTHLKTKIMQNENGLAATETAEVVMTETAVEVVQQHISSEMVKAMLTTLDKVEKSEGMVQTNADYFQFTKPGDKSQGVFVGYQSVRFKKKDGSDELTDPQDAVKWLVKETVEGKKTAKFKLAAGAALVNEFKRNNIQPGTGVLITFRELGGENKQVKLFDVALIAV